MAHWYWVGADGKVYSTDNPSRIPAGASTSPTFAGAQAIAQLAGFSGVQGLGAALRPPDPPPVTSPRYAAWKAWKQAYDAGNRQSAQQWMDRYNSIPASEDTAPSATSNPADTPAATPAAPGQDALDAKEMLNVWLAQMGLTSLSGKVWEWLTAGYSAQAIQLMVYNTPEFIARFPAIPILAQQGRGITPAEYIQFERSIAALEHQYGMVTGIASSKETIAHLLEHGVSPAEMDERMSLAVESSMNADPEVKDMLQKWYGLSQGDIASYMLSPDVALPLLKKQARAAQIGGAMFANNLGDIGAGLGEDLALHGLTKEGAQRVGAQAGVEQTMLQFGLGGQLNLSEQLHGTAGVGDVQKFQKVSRSRRAAFQGGGEAYLGQEGVSGAGSAAS